MARAAPPEGEVKRLTMLITPDGEWLFPGGADFLVALGDAEPDYDATSFAVRNLGFIKFDILDQQLIEIELHPRVVEHGALRALEQQLLAASIGLFRLRYLQRGEWRSEITSSAEHTVERLKQLCAPSLLVTASERFVVEPSDYDGTFRSEAAGLRLLAQKWRSSFGQFDMSVLSLAAKQGLLSRLMIAGVDPRGQEPVWRYIGEGHHWMGPYVHRGIGENVANMPDREYGEWARQFYRSVALSGEPRFDVVTARVQYEDETGKPERPVRYERLMLPWKMPGSEVFVTMCSRTLARGPASSEAESSGSENLAIRKLARSA